MALERFDFRFAYQFCAEVQDIVFKAKGIEDDEPEWFFSSDDAEFLFKAAVPNKATLLHEYIYEVVSFGTDYETGHGAPEEFPNTFGPLLIAAGLELPRWLTPSEVVDHIHDLDLVVREGVRRLVPAAFHVLYADLHFLHAFQTAVANKVRSYRSADFPDLFREDGVLNRPNYWPEWLRRGVFYRDKGLCQNCYRDLSGTLNLEGRVHLDHILPLVRGGSNDPTNLQILCSECNLQKGGKDTEGNWHTQTYW